MMRYEVRKAHEVPDEAVIEVGDAFLEWLDDFGYELKWRDKMRKEPTGDGEGLSYRQLAELYVEYKGAHASQADPR